VGRSACSAAAHVQTTNKPLAQLHHSTPTRLQAAHELISSYRGYLTITPI
jgi:hypothetical protein